MLMLAGCFITCSTNNDIVEDIPEDDIDMSLIDFSNIRNLYAQPLPVIQKCLEGKWKYLRASGSWGTELIFSDGEYMILTSERIIMGSNTDGVTIDAPLEWIKHENGYGSPYAYALYYGNGRFDRLLPVQIIGGILCFSDMATDGGFSFYVKY